MVGRNCFVSNSVFACVNRNHPPARVQSREQLARPRHCCGCSYVGGLAYRLCRNRALAHAVAIELRPTNCRQPACDLAGIAGRMVCGFVGTLFKR